MFFALPARVRTMMLVKSFQVRMSCGFVLDELEFLELRNGRLQSLTNTRKSCLTCFRWTACDALKKPLTKRIILKTLTANFVIIFIIVLQYYFSILFG